MFDIVIFLFVISIIFRIAKQTKTAKKAHGPLKNATTPSTDAQKAYLQQLLENRIEQNKENYIHSNIDYANKDYVQDHDHSFKINEEPMVKRGMFDKRTSGETITRKDYD